MIKRMSIGAVLAIFITLMISPFTALSRSTVATRLSEAFTSPAQAKGLEGTWRVQVTVRNCNTGDAIATFPSLVTYSGGGTVSESTSSIPPTRRYPGQGVWHYVGGQQYAASFMFFRFNADGSYAGTQKITQQIELVNGGDELAVTATFEVFDVGGTVIGTGCVTTTATRFE